MNVENVARFGLMMNEEYSWGLDDDMGIKISHNGIVVMQISVYEVIENCNRVDIINHVEECERSHWLSNWHRN